MTNDILVFAEIRDGDFKKINGELVTAAKTLAEKSGGGVHIAVLGDGVDQAVEEAKGFDVQKVFTVKSPVLAKYSTEGFAGGLEAVVKEADPGVLLFGATATGKDLSARLAARLGAALMTDCTDVDFEDGALKVKRPVFSGKVYATVVSTKDGLKMASIRPNIFPAAEKSGGGAEVVEVALPVTEDQIGAVVTGVEGVSTGRKDVTEAEVIVAGGRSIKSEENFKILEDLADVLGGSVGASRAAVDAGYSEHSKQIGQTGKVVNPKLYFACGVSGAIQHLVGMRTSKVIVSINKDPNAPIFQYSDYGIEGDLFEVVPLLTEELKKLVNG